MRFLIGILLFLTLSSPVLAEGGSREEARRFFRIGMRFEKQGHYGKGVHWLQKAQDTVPHPSNLYNIAIMQLRAGRHKQAANALEEYIKDVPQDYKAEALLMHIRAIVLALEPPQVVRTEPEPSPSSTE